MGERFGPGDQVRASRTDPAHHTRIPRYVRGAAGTVVELEGRHPLPDLSSRRLPAGPEPVYAVQFTAEELFGAGDHTVTVALWESYLEATAPAGREAGHLAGPEAGQRAGPEAGQRPGQPAQA